MTRFFTSPYLLLILNMMFWSGNWIVGRAFRDDFSPLGLNFWRWVIALVLLLPFTWRQVWESRAALLREWKAMLGLGLLGIALFNMMLYTGLRSTTAVNGVLIHTSQPVVIVMLAWLLVGERVNLRQALGIVVSLAGVLIIISRGDPATLLGVQFNKGDLWMLAAVPIWGVYTILLRRKPKDLPPLALLTVMFFIGVVILLGPYVWAELYVRPQVTLHWASLGGLIYVASLSSVVGLVFYNMGVSALGPNVAGLFLHLVPVFTTALAWIFLGETLQLYHLPGVLLIFTGITLTTKGGPRIQQAGAQGDPAA